MCELSYCVLINSIDLGYHYYRLICLRFATALNISTERPRNLPGFTQLNPTTHRATPTQHALRVRSLLMQEIYSLADQTTPSKAQSTASWSHRQRPISILPTTAFRTSECCRIFHRRYARCCRLGGCSKMVMCLARLLPLLNSHICMKHA
jgi:hypothetical protein